jgi:hypothetical protein
MITNEEINKVIERQDKVIKDLEEKIAAGYIFCDVNKIIKEITEQYKIRMAEIATEEYNNGLDRALKEIDRVFPVECSKAARALNDARDNIKSAKITQ